MSARTLHPNSSLQRGKYKIIRHISSGGFGNTYEGIHTMMDTRVAIKEFFPKMFCNRDENTSHVTVATQNNRELVDKLRKKFIEEAKAIFMMNNPGIVKVHDIFEENGTAYYVMDYIDGKSLQKIVEERGALPEFEALGYIRQIADALNYVHSLNRLHLDIKPGNIMVDRSGKAILIDFGASKHYDYESGENTSTLMGVNTQGYAPIEQTYNGFSHFSPATDIYALGATLYKLLTSFTPPDANLLRDGEAQLVSLPSGISRGTKTAIEAAMRPLRKDRVQSVDEFLRLLSLKGSSTNYNNPAGHSDRDDEATVLQEYVRKPVNEHRREANSGYHSNHRSGNDGGKWGVLGIILIAIVVFGIYYVSNSKITSSNTQPQISESPQIPDFPQNPTSYSSNQEISFSYQKYHNARFGYSVEYPNNLKEGTRSQNGDGARFRSPSGEADFTVYGYYNNGYMNDGTIENEYNDVVADHGRSVTYKLLKSNYFVVSGKESGKIFYHVTKWSGDIGVTAILEYKEEYKESYDKACSIILKSLTVSQN